MSSTATRKKKSPAQSVWKVWPIHPWLSDRPHVIFGVGKIRYNSRSNLGRDYIQALHSFKAPAVVGKKGETVIYRSSADKKVKVSNATPGGPESDAFLGEYSANRLVQRYDFNIVKKLLQFLVSPLWVPGANYPVIKLGHRYDTQAALAHQGIGPLPRCRAYSQWPNPSPPSIPSYLLHRLGLEASLASFLEGPLQFLPVDYALPGAISRLHPSEPFLRQPTRFFISLL